MGRRGFVNYDIWIVGVVLLVVGSIVVSQFDRVVRRRRQQEATAFIHSVASFQAAEYARSHIYPDALPADLIDPKWPVELMSGDSTGWGIWVHGPAKGWIQVGCGMYEGSDRHVPLAGMAVPGQVTCE